MANLTTTLPIQESRYMKDSANRKTIIKKMSEWRKIGASYKYRQDYISGWHIDRMVDFIEEFISESKEQHKLGAKRTLILSMLSLNVENLTIKPRLDIDSFDVEMGFDEKGNRTCKLIYQNPDLLKENNDH